MPSIIASAIGAVGAIGGGLISSSGAKSAANTEAAAGNQSAQVQQGIYNQTRSDLAPYLNMGTGALSQLSSLLGIGGTSGPDIAGLTSALQNYPGYQFAQKEGLNALNASGAARGVLNSGATVKGAEAFGQGLATSTLSDYLNRLGSTAQLGESAGSITGNTGVSSGANIGNSIMAAGSATGTGQQASALSLAGGFNGALNNSLLAYQLSQSGNAGLNPVSVTPANMSVLNSLGYLEQQ